MVKDEARRLEALAKTIHLYYDDGRQYNLDDWHDVVVEVGLGIDSRTASSYFRLAKVRRLIEEPTKGRWRKGTGLEGFLPKSENERPLAETGQQEDV